MSIADAAVLARRAADALADLDATSSPDRLAEVACMLQHARLEVGRELVEVPMLEEWRRQSGPWATGPTVRT